MQKWTVTQLELSIVGITGERVSEPHVDEVSGLKTIMCVSEYVSNSSRQMKDNT